MLFAPNAVELLGNVANIVSRYISTRINLDLKNSEILDKSAI